MRRHSVTLLATALLAFLFFAAELSGYFTGVSSPIGEIKLAQGAVSRLPRDGFVWDRAARGGKFSQGDAIATGEESFAVLALARGGEVELPAGALVVFRETERELQLQFLRGRARRAVSSPRFVGPAPFTVEAARAQLLPSSIFSNGSTLTIESLPPVPELLEPGIDAQANFDQVRTFALRWRLPEGEGRDLRGWKYELLFGPLDGGEPKALRLSEPRFNLDPLPSGRYLWSVRAVAPDGRKSPAAPPRRIEILERRTLKEPRYLPPRIEKAGAPRGT
ncbi:MAG: hypothetical protein NDJ90_06885 [Oligoflexia bacterium]|nr:hypothetical protein [Oligoflexia bacterium]